MSLVKGQYALVTGGGTGIGFGIARRLLEEGAANVLIVGRREDVLVDSVKRLKNLVANTSVDYKICDITDEEQVAAAVAAASDDDNQLDIFVANAGSGFPGPILELDASAWRYCCELNIIGSALCIKHAGKAMKVRGGSIITISSTSASYHDKWMSPYGASKAGLEHLTKSAAIELAAFNIRVNSVAPGFIESESVRDSFTDALKSACIEKTLLKRSGEPEEIGDAIVYLASKMGRWVTGQVIGVDGGLSVNVGTDFGEMATMVVGEDAMEQAGYNKP